MSISLPSRYSHLIKALFLIILLAGTHGIQAQVIFRDDFERSELGGAWQTNYWTIVDGAAFNGSGGPLRTTAAYTDSSFIIETPAKGFTTTDYGREFRITFGQDNLFNDSMYVLSYTSFGILALGRSTDNVIYPQVLDQAGIYPDFNDTQWYKFKIARYKSGLIQVYIDKGAGYGSTPLLEAIDSAYGTLGHFGWQENTETFSVSFYVDWIEARKPSKEKPAVTEKPAQDSLIAQVSAKSVRPYRVAKLNSGIEQFTDRDYTITSVPAYLKGASFVQTAMEDKFRTAADFLTLFIKKDAIIYIGYDPRGTTVPAWLSEWTKTGDIIGTTDPGSAYLEVYSRLIESPEVFPRPLILGGNYASPASGAKMNYLIAAVERPAAILLQAEDAVLSGTVVAKNHSGYIGTGFVDYIHPSDDYIEWSVNIKVPGTYNLDFTFAHAGTTDRALQIGVDGANAEVVQFAPQGSWDTWSSRSGPNVYLTAGVHKVRATALGSGGPNIDQLGVIYVSSYPPLPGALAIAAKDVNIAQPLGHSVNVYPNPFLSTTKIYYALKVKSNVVLSVYSLQGQRLKTLVNGFREAGNYEVTFDAAKLSEGMYVYRLQIGKEIKTGKLIKQ